MVEFLPHANHTRFPLANLQKHVYRMHQEKCTLNSNTHKLITKLVPDAANKKKHKIILIGDSHVRGCSEKLANFLGSSCNVIGISKPNADLKAITSKINMRIENLRKKALVINCGKTRGIAKNESKTGLKHPMQFTKSTCNTNVIVMSAPLR